MTSFLEEGSMTKYGVFNVVDHACLFVGCKERVFPSKQGKNGGHKGLRRDSIPSFSLHRITSTMFCEEEDLGVLACYFGYLLFSKIGCSLLP